MTVPQDIKLTRHAGDLDDDGHDADLSAHIADTSAAHAASAIGFTPNGSIAATDVQAAIQEVRDEASGSALTVDDEGTPLSSSATTLDFVGAGVTASGTGATKTITIPGGASFIGTRCRNSAVQSLTNSTFTPINLDTEDYDTDTMHYTSVAALTGTVSKTASSATLTGSSTLFTSELAVGQLISVPGTAAEVRVVTAIASDTSLTVAATFANSASGQTATRVNNGIVFRTAGKYTIIGQLGFATNATGVRYLNLVHNRGATATTIDSKDLPGGLTSDGTRLGVATDYDCNQWDWVQMTGFHSITGGGALNTEAGASYSPVLNVKKVG